MSKIIAIGREFGSGGHLVGQLLSEQLGIPYYDHELLSLAVEHGDFDRGEPIEKFDEKKANPIFFEVNYIGNENAPKGEPVVDALFKLEKDVMKKIAEEGDAIIIGRCADQVLKDAGHHVLSIFIGSTPENRTTRIMRKYDVSESKALSMIKKKDANRKAFYKYHTGKAWGIPQSYDYYFNSTDLSLMQIADEIAMIYDRF